MKKVISILLLLVLAFGVCACAGKKSSSKAKQGHLGEWRLERFQWRTEFVQGVHFSSARLTVGESGEFEFALDYEKNNTPHQYGFSGSYTISGTDLTLKVARTKSVDDGQETNSDVDPARVIEAEFTGDNITIPLTESDSPYLDQITLAKS